MKYLFLLITLLWYAGICPAQDFPAPMQPKRVVNDFTNLLSRQDQARLENKLRKFNDTTSTQIAIVTVPSLHGYAPNDYAQRLAEQWGIGQKGKDNGILVLVKPKSRDENGQVAIAVGYGLEGVVPDAIASRIIRNEIIPEFQNNRYYEGLDKATNVLMKLTSGEYSADEYATNESTEYILAGIFLLFIVFIFLASRFKSKGPGQGSGTSSQAGPFIFWGGLGGGLGGGRSTGGGGFGGFGGFGGGQRQTGPRKFRRRRSQRQLVKTTTFFNIPSTTISCGFGYIYRNNCGKKWKKTNAISNPGLPLPEEAIP